MKTLILSVAFLMISGAAQAQTAPVKSAKTQAVIDSLADAARKVQNAPAASPVKAAAAGSGLFDNTPAVPQGTPVQTLPRKGKPVTKTSDDGIVYPDDPPGKQDDGGDNPSPGDQVAKMIAEALKSKEVRASVDNLRQDQMGKIFTKEVKIGAAVAGAGLVTAGVGLLIGASAVTGVGLAVVGAVILVGALFALFGKK
jgi:hypothetical protein